jgi:hypothetical protein
MIGPTDLLHPSPTPHFKIVVLFWRKQIFCTKFSAYIESKPRDISECKNCVTWKNQNCSFSLKRRIERVVGDRKSCSRGRRWSVTVVPACTVKRKRSVESPALWWCKPLCNGKLCRLEPHANRRNEHLYLKKNRGVSAFAIRLIVGVCCSPHRIIQDLRKM